MLVLVYFDWNGSHEQVEEENKLLNKACDKYGAKYIGLFRPSQVKWDYCHVFEADGEKTMTKVWNEIMSPRPMGHNVAHYLWPCGTGAEWG